MPRNSLVSEPPRHQPAKTRTNINATKQFVSKRTIVTLHMSRCIASSMRRDMDTKHCDVVVRLPGFASFVARAQLLHVDAPAPAVPTLTANGAPSARCSPRANMRWGHVDEPPSQEAPTTPLSGSSIGISSRRSLLRLAPAQVRVREDGSPELPMTTAPRMAPKRFLQRHERCQIILRVLAGERQAHLAKEFRISRAAVSYLLRHPWNVFRPSARHRV